MTSCLSDTLVQQLQDLAARSGASRLVLFGSRARGDYHRSSDIDLAVWGGNIPRFALDIDEETSTLLKYDVVDMGQDVSAGLLDAVQREGRILYEKV